MRPNLKCFKAILFYTQDNITLEKPSIYLSEYIDKLNDFSKDEIINTFSRMEHEDLFLTFAVSDGYEIGRFGDLTSKGHEIAERLRNDVLWKNILSSGLSSIPVVIQAILGA